MEKQLITNELLLAFSEYLQSNERAPGTIEKYLRDVSAFRIWLGNRSVTKELTAEWKERLLENNHAPVTVNSMLARYLINSQAWRSSGPASRKSFQIYVSG